MSIKEEREMGRLQSILNRGTQISRTFSASSSILEQKKSVPVTCSMGCGSPISSCNALKPMGYGVLCVLMNAPVSRTAGETSSSSCTSLTKPPANSVVKFQPRSSGNSFWMPKSKLGHPTSVIRMPPTPSPTSKT